MLTWLAPIIVFGLVVFVHELGHFLAAKAVGVYAPRFSIGFGPALFRKRWGETEYVIAALPLGGYVRLASREDEAMALLEGGGERPPDVPTVGANDSPPLVDEQIGEGLRPDDYDPEAMWPFGPKPVPEHRWFESKPLPARLLILIAGVTMNALLTFVVATGTIAYYGTGYRPAVIDSVLADRPAQAAGLQAGDSIVAVDGAPVTRWTEVVELVGAAAGRTIAVDVRRGGAPVRIEVRPEPTVEPNPITGAADTVGRIGAAPTTTVVRTPVGMGEAVTRGSEATWGMAVAVVTIVKGLFSGVVSVDNLGGPIAIAQTSVEAARGGLEPLFGLLAFLSINIAILNLLPIPILDGGQILMNIAESVKGSPFSAVTRNSIMKVGLVAIGLLFALVMYNDLRRLVQSVFG
jgi:regulator of sigma E protease